MVRKLCDQIDVAAAVDFCAVAIGPADREVLQPEVAFETFLDGVEMCVRGLGRSRRDS